jgi:hypothetical protein
MTVGGLVLYDSVKNKVFVYVSYKFEDIPAIPDLEEAAEPEESVVQIAEAPEYVSCL